MKQLTTKEIRVALGKTGATMSESEIQKLMAVFDNLSDCWLDRTETEIFGKTIAQLAVDNTSQT